MWYILLVLAGLLLVVVAWIVGSLPSVKSDEVALRRFFGRLEKIVRYPGLVFIPWFFGRINLARYTTKQIHFRYDFRTDGKPEDLVFTSDHQPVRVIISGEARAPYDDADSLALMTKSGVVMEETAFHAYYGSEILSGMRNIIAEYTLEEAISRSNLTAIAEKSAEFFLRHDGLFFKSGICGANSDDTTPGQGEIIIRVESVLPRPELQQAMEASTIARYEAEAAKETAKMNAEQIGGQVLGIVARKHGMTIEALEADIKAHPEKVGKSIEDGGYGQTFEWAQAQTTRDRAGNVSITQAKTDIDISSGGEAIRNPEFQGIAAIVGGFVAAKESQGGGGKGGKRSSSGRGKRPKDMTDDEAIEAANRP